MTQFIKKKHEKFWETNLKKFLGDIGKMCSILSCPGHPRTSLAPGIREPLHALSLRAPSLSVLLCNVLGKIYWL